MNGPYGTKRSYQTAFNASGYPIGRNGAGMQAYGGQGWSTGGGYARRRGQYYRRSNRSNYLQRTIQRVFNTRTNSVYPRPERKFLDNAITPTITSTGNVIPLNTIVQGIGSNQRIGAQTATSGVYYNYVLRQGATPTTTAVRILLFWDREPNGVAPAVTDVLAAATVTAPMNLLNRNRFVILDDDRDTLSTNGDQIRFITDFRKIDQLSTFADATSTAQTGGLMLLYISDQAAGATAPTISGTWRVRFMDN